MPKCNWYAVKRCRYYSQPESCSTALSDTNSTAVVCTADISSGDIYKKESDLVISIGKDGDIGSKEIIGSNHTQKTINVDNAVVSNSDKPINIPATQVVRTSNEANDINGNGKDKTKSSVISTEDHSKPSIVVKSGTVPCKANDNSDLALHARANDVHTNAELQSNDRVCK